MAKRKPPKNNDKPKSSYKSVVDTSKNETKSNENVSLPSCSSGQRKTLGLRLRAPKLLGPKQQKPFHVAQKQHKPETEQVNKETAQDDFTPLETWNQKKPETKSENETLVKSPVKRIQKGKIKLLPPSPIRLRNRDSKSFILIIQALSHIHLVN